MPKNTSFHGINHCSYANIIKNEKTQKIGVTDINSSDRNLLKKNDSKKNKEHIRFEKIKFKEFGKIIEYNKIKELLKISKKKDKNTNNTERSKKDIKKSCGNLFRNKTETNNKIMTTKINNDIENSGKMKKNSSTIGNTNKSNLMKGVNSEQKLSFVNRIYKKEFGKYFHKKIIKSPTSVSIMNLNKNNKRSHSQGINGRSIELINYKQISLKSKLNNIYFNLFKNISDNNNKNNKINKLLTPTPYSLNRKYEKSTKRNLTTIPYNNETNNCKKNNKKNKNRLLNEVFNTVNFNILENNLNHNSNYYKYNYYFNLGNYYSEINKNKTYKYKKKECQSYRENRKIMINITNKKKNYIQTSLNNRFNDNNSKNNIFINNSCSNNKKKGEKLYNYKRYSIIISKNKNTQNRNKSNENEKMHYSKNITNNKIINPKISNSYNPLSLRQKSLASSIGGSLSNSNADIIKKRDSFTYKSNKTMKKKKKIKNISIKKLNVPPFCNINKNNNNSFIRYKKCFKISSNKNIIDSEALIISNKEKTFNKTKKNKKKLNISANDNYIINHQNTFLHNVNPIYLNIRNNNANITKKNSNNINRNKRLNTINPGNSLKNNELFNSQIFNNYYSINNIDASNLPVRVINFYN